MIARLTVQRGSLTEYPLAEKVRGGWQNGVTFYPDADVTGFTPLVVSVQDEPDWEYGWRAAYADGEIQDESGYGLTRKKAERAVILNRELLPGSPNDPLTYSLVRRKKASPAGPWVPVVDLPEGGES